MKTIFFLFCLVLGVVLGSNFKDYDFFHKDIKKEEQIRLKKELEIQEKNRKQTESFNNELSKPTLTGTLPDGRKINQYVHEISNCSGSNCSNIIYVVDGTPSVTNIKEVRNGKKEEITSITTIK